MTQDGTPRWDLPLLHAGQAQKELFHNEALARIDMLLHAGVGSADLIAPPASYGVGDCWIVAAGAVGVWAGRDGAVACWTDGGWRFVAPRVGLVVHVADRGHAMIYDGAVWVDGPLRADGIYVGGNRVVGGRGAAIADPGGEGVIDEGARGAIAEILSALRNHGLIEA
jgi:hypothetical protein